MFELKQGQVLYYGCAKGIDHRSDIGHGPYLCAGYDQKYLESTDFNSIRNLHKEFDRLDGGFCIKGTYENFKAKLTRLDGFTVLAFWDQTGDSRPNSHSTFVMKGPWHFPQMIEQLKKAAPALFKRYNTEIELVHSTDYCTTASKTEHEKEIAELVDLIRALKLRITFIGWPIEPTWDASTDQVPHMVPDWRKEIKWIEEILKKYENN